MRHQARRWKTATRESNRPLLGRYLLPFFGDMRAADIARADVRRWLDAMSGTPGNATASAPPPPSTPISTAPCGTPPRKPPASLFKRWGTRPSLRRCPTRRRAEILRLFPRNFPNPVC